MKPMNNESDFWKEILKNKTLVKILIISVILALIFFLASGGIFIWDNIHGKHSKFFGIESNIPSPYRDTIVENPPVKEDTVYIPSQSKRKVHKDYLTPPRPSPKMDSVKSTPAQISGTNVNTGINNGIIGGQGNKIENFGTHLRKISGTDFFNFWQNFPDKNTRIAVSFIGSPDGEMINVKDQIIKGLKDYGYKNIGEKSGIAYFDYIPKNIVIEKQKDGSVIFWVPPAPVQ